MSDTSSILRFLGRWLTGLMFVQLLSGAALAQDDTAVVLRPNATHEKTAPMRDPVERVIRSRLGALNIVRVVGSPAVNVDDLQLAVGCLGHTVECYQAISEELGVRAMIMSSLDIVDSEIVFSIEYFENGSERTKLVTRRILAENPLSKILGIVDEMLRELFDLPPAEVSAVSGDSTGRSGPSSQTGDTGGGGGGASVDEADEGSSFPIVPVSVIGVGVVALGTGVVFAVLSADTQAEFDALDVNDPADADRASELSDRGQTQSTLSNVFLGVGAAAVVTGTVLFFVLDNDGESESKERGVAIAPVVSKDLLGVTLQGTFGGQL